MSSLENNDILSKKLGEEGIKLIIENNLYEAIEYFTKALAYNSTDHRHFLNRCLCYLRLNENERALSDAEYVLEKTRTDLYLFIARIRAGQALFGLQKYVLAENNLKQAIAIYPNNVYAKRELLRIQVRRIVLNGFNEKDAVLALKIHPTTLAAITYLSSNALRPLRLSAQQITDNSDILDHDLNNTYYSSDEDDDSNNFELLNNMSDYQPGEINFHQLKPFIISGAKNKTILNTFGIWVGNLNDTITEDLLQAVFNHFGNVTSVYKPPNALYAFVDFDNSEDVKKILEISTYNLCGRRLTVQAAYRKF